MVLVLNATEEPLGVIEIKRAVTLIVTGRATLVLGTGRKVHSETVEMDEPSVIKLTTTKRIDRSRSVPLSRKALFARDNQQCAFCETGKAETIDHVFPKSRGGKHEWMNVVASCGPCNWHKRDRTPEEAGMQLRFRPFIPTREFMLGQRNRPEWEPYLYRQGKVEQ